MTSFTEHSPKFPDCDYRGDFLKVIDCPCGREWSSHACSQVEGGICVPNLDQLNSSAIKVHGPLPECMKCVKRTVNGQVVGIPTRDEVRKLRNLPRKEMTDAKARRLGIKPVEQAVTDVFPRDRMVSDYELCRSVLHHDDAEFNPSIIEFEGQRWIAYRQNWSNSNIVLSKANPAWEPDCGPDGCRFINIPIEQENSSGREDPRLFAFRGELWVSYSGYCRHGQYGNTVCIGRLRNGAMDCHFPLHYEHRARNEKNWVFFEHDNRLFCTYLCTPAHVVLECDQFNCKLAYATQWKSPYSTGHIRGGATPVLHNGEFYHFFHSVTPTYGTKVYTCGVFTFESKPPFRVLRCTKRPLIAPRVDDGEPGGKSAAVFPGGAVFDNDKRRWHVAYGYLDKECRIASFHASDIESELYAV